MPDTEVQPGAETLSGNDDVRADVLAAIEQLKGASEDITAEQASAEAVDAPPTQDRARNERGQFAKAESADPGESATPVSDAGPTSEQPAELSNALQPPTSWSAEAKAEWSKLSPALQQAVSKREGEMSSGAQKWSEERRQYDEMLTPVRAAAQRAGVDEREGLQKLIAANDFLERDPENAIRWLAQAYNVDLSKPPSQQPQPRPDSAVNQLYQRIAQLEGHINSREEGELQQTISAFASEPGHEHFEAVRPFMGHLLSTGQATSMQDAYDKAIWATPEIRTQLIAGQTAEAARKAKERETAERARRGAISASGSPSGAPVVAKQDYETVEDATRAAFRAHGVSV